MIKDFKSSFINKTFATYRIVSDDTESAESWFINKTNFETFKHVYSS